MLEEIFALDITVLENSKDIWAQRPTHYLKSSHQIHWVRFLVEIQVMPKGKTLKRQ